ncbi:hypothetical protein M9Y10_036154 [Tritrichomonas musculus]|uniref:Myb-like DNA-binding domain containing protein n=1 Tax=Tritrichomonas musculus TaxID=1915356 RepID=A0ABR2GUK5_9EUKA
MSVLPIPFFQRNYSMPQTKQRRKFTPQEDEVLKRLIYEIGSFNWNKISELMPGRTAKQCRDRYCNYLSEPHSNCPWNPEEDEILLSLLKLLGPKWVEISHHIPGRLGNDVKNRWYKHLCKSYSYKKGQLTILNQNNEMMKEVLPIEQAPNSDPETLEKIQEKYKISALLW